MALAIQTASRPNGSINVSRFYDIAEAAYAMKFLKEHDAANT
jgi:hypothetical protein